MTRIYFYLSLILSAAYLVTQESAIGFLAVLSMVATLSSRGLDKLNSDD